MVAGTSPDATVGRAEALISRKELATQALDAATGGAQGRA